MAKDLVIIEKRSKNGEEYTSFNKIGEMFEANDKQYIKLYHIPNTLIHCLDKKKKKAETSQSEYQEQGY